MKRALVQRAADYASKARAEHTTMAYRADWQGFKAWCLANDRPPRKANGAVVAAAYLAHLADNDRAYATIERAYVGIVHHLRRQGAGAE